MTSEPTPDGVPRIVSVAFTDPRVESFFDTLSMQGQVDFLAPHFGKLPAGTIFRLQRRHSAPVCWRCGRRLTRQDSLEKRLGRHCALIIEREMQDV